MAPSLGRTAQPTCCALCGRARLQPVASRAEGPRQGTRQGRAAAKKARLPDSGYFAEADPHAEVYSPLRGKGPQDFTKRGGRYTSDFIWNTNWQEQLEYEESQARQRQQEQAKPKPAKAGFLSLSRSLDLNSTELDLSEQLRPRASSSSESSSASAPSGRAATSDGPGGVQAAQRARYYSVPPTKLEQRQWARSGKFGKRVVALAPTAPEEEAAQAAKLAEERERYDKLKGELQAATLSLTLACFGATWLFYSQNIAVSYAVGAAGGLVYLRALHRSVDAVGGFTVGGALSQQRLLVPIILVGAFNRWNTLEAEATGITLQLLPMLLGFFTYKGAVIGRHSLEALSSLTDSLRPTAPDADQASEAGHATDAGAQPGAGDEADVKQAFNRRMLTQ